MLNAIKFILWRYSLLRQSMAYVGNRHHSRVLRGFKMNDYPTEYDQENLDNQYFAKLFPMPRVLVIYTDKPINTPLVGLG
jgi:hypothetical protein